MREEETIISYRKQLRYVLVLLSRGEVEQAQECMHSVAGEETLKAMLSLAYTK